MIEGNLGLDHEPIPTLSPEENAKLNPLEEANLDLHRKNEGKHLGEWSREDLSELARIGTETQNILDGASKRFGLK